MTSQVLLRLLWLITDSHNQRKYSFWLHTGEKRCDLFPIPVYKSSEIHQQTLAQNPCTHTITKERPWECDPLSPLPLPSAKDKMLFLIRGSCKIRTAHQCSWWLVLSSNIIYPVSFLLIFMVCFPEKENAQLWNTDGFRRLILLAVSTLLHFIIIFFSVIGLKF